MQTNIFITIRGLLNFFAKLIAVFEIPKDFSKKIMQAYYIFS